MTRPKYYVCTTYHWDYDPLTQVMTLSWEWDPMGTQEYARCSIEEDTTDMTPSAVQKAVLGMLEAAAKYKRDWLPGE